MYKTNKNLYFLSGIIVALLLNGCSADDTPVIPPGDMVSVRFEINSINQAYTKAPGDAGNSVNRILILPFKKTNEDAANDAVNFTPDYNAARQINVSSFPAIATMLTLSAASTYQVIAIGYSQSDYNFTNPQNTDGHFNIGSTSIPATLANLYLKPTDVTVVPEFFSCIGSGYSKGTLVGRYFKPGNINNIQGEMRRIVSGMTLSITNIPDFVTSISLVAEQLVTATSIIDGVPVLSQTIGDGGTRLLEKKVPISGAITFNRYMLATLDTNKSLFYLDVTYGIFTGRYTIKIADNANVVSANRIILTPNHRVIISGDYNSINLGFKIVDDINLDDNIWDGLQ